MYVVWCLLELLQCCKQRKKTFIKYQVYLYHYYWILHQIFQYNQKKVNFYRKQMFSYGMRHRCLFLFLFCYIVFTLHLYIHF